MAADMVMTLVVLAFAVDLFFFEWVRLDVVGIMMMVLLPLIGLVSPKQAFMGLSSNGVVSILAVIIIGAGLDKTGVMNKVASSPCGQSGQETGGQSGRPQDASHWQERRAANPAREGAGFFPGEARDSRRTGTFSGSFGEIPHRHRQL